VILVFYAVFYRKTLVDVDWPLLVFFLLAFVDFRSLSTVPAVSELFLRNVDTGSQLHIFLLSVLLSQAVSNVPAVFFTSGLSNRWLPIAYGVNVGGNGLVTGSLANFIAIRLMAGETLRDGENVWVLFHRYSLVFFAVTVAEAAFVLWAVF